MKKSLLAISLLVTSSFALADSLVPEMSSSDEYGCKAFMCFAGGLGLSECQSTITKVHRDLAKGKGFPHCSFLGSNSDGSVGGKQFGEGVANIKTVKTKKYVYLYVDNQLQSKIKRK